MTDKEKLDAIRAEIHRLVDVRGYDREIANDLFAFMDSLPNEPVSEDLNEAAKNYAATGEFLDNKKEMIDFQKEKSFKAGAKWQNDQLPKWKKRPVGGCWSGEIAVHPSARLFRYEHYVINADKLFELLSKEE